VDDAARVKQLERHVRKQGLPFFRISAVTGEGVDALLQAVWREIAAVRELPAAVDTPDDDDGVDLIAAARLVPPKPARAKAEREP
jgi:hypothetical protein